LAVAVAAVAAVVVVVRRPYRWGTVKARARARAVVGTTRRVPRMELGSPWLMDG